MNEHEVLIVQAAANIMRQEARRIPRDESEARHAGNSCEFAADQIVYALRCVERLEAEAGS